MPLEVLKTPKSATRLLLLKGDAWTEAVASSGSDKLVRLQLQMGAVSSLRAATTPSGEAGFLINGRDIYEDTLAAGDKLYTYVPGGGSAILLIEVRDA